MASLLASLLAGCMGQPSQRQPPAERDPWASAGAGSGSAAGAGAGSGAAPPRPASGALANPLGGLGALSRLGESLAEPGPYEAPRTSAGFDPDLPHLVVLTLAGPIVERSSFSWRGGSGTELREVQRRLDALALDPQAEGVLLRVGELDLSFPDALELRASLRRLRAAGKRLRCHSHGAGNVAYLVMAACERVALASLGQLAITGPAALPVHLRPLLARFGVVADFLHVGAYKGAAEPFTRDAPSPQSAEVLGQILDQHYATLVARIAEDRGLTPAQVVELIDQGVFTPAAALQAKLIDQVASFEELRDGEGGGAWTEASFQDGGGAASLRAMATLMQFLGLQPAQRPSHPRVAVVYALGNIIDGGGAGLLGAREEIAAATLVPALRVLAADDSVKAVLLRIDSGGGSAQASELIWQAMQALVARKPVVVSMSDVAASGGYYLACGATKIFAQPDTLTGSIGVIGGRLAVGDALARQGVRTYPVGRGKRAAMVASLGAWTAEERALIQRLMEDVYDTFVARVAAGRGRSDAEVRALAQGRVWTGARAKALGLVDELGGFDEALAEAAKLGGVPADTELEIYPPTPTLRDLAVSFGQDRGGWLGAVRTSALMELEPRVGAIALELVQQLAAFRDSAVQTVTWVPQVR